MAYSEVDKEEIWNSIIEEMMTGRSLRSILKDPGMPPRKTIYQWIVKDKEKGNQYAIASDIRADEIFDEILNIADSVDDDIIILDNGKEAVNKSVIMRDTLRINSRKWILSKMNPKKYGDRIEIDNKHEIKDTPNFNFKDLNNAK